MAFRWYSLIHLLEISYSHLIFHRLPLYNVQESTVTTLAPLRSGPVTHRACPTGGTLRARPYAKAVLRRICFESPVNLIHRRRHILSPFATLRPITPSAHRASSAPSFSLHRRRNKCDAVSVLTPSQPTLHALRPNTKRNAALHASFRFSAPTSLRPGPTHQGRLLFLTPHAPLIADAVRLPTLRAVTPPAKSRPGVVPALR